MIDKEKRELINELVENSTIFDNPSFDKSIIGVDLMGKIVYNLDMMVKELAEDDNMSEEEAYDFIMYNTVGVLSYCEDSGPIIVDTSLLGGMYE